jgi:uncharacterized damage-inducible protein DinB
MAALQDGTREWRGELGEVPNDALNWQPFAGGPSIAAEIYHMIDTEAGWIEGAAHRKRTEEEAEELLSDAIDVDAVSWPTIQASSLADLYALQDRYPGRTLETLARSSTFGKEGPKWKKPRW